MDCNPINNLRIYEMHKHLQLKKYALMMFVFAVISKNVYADLILTSPPRESPQVGEQRYGTIAKALSDLLGKKIVYEHPKNWIEYTRNMRANKYDIIFDGPHFVAWRMKHLDHVPVVKLPGTLGFVFVAKDSDKKAHSLRDIVGKSLCGIPAPNLGTLVAYSIFNNPVIQPEIHFVRGGPVEVLKSFLRGECEYAVLFDKFYKNVPAEKKQHIKIIARSKQMPSQTISVSSRVSKEDARKITDYLISSQGAKAGSTLLHFFAKKKPKFVRANPKDYDGLENLLEGVEFGW